MRIFLFLALLSSANVFGQADPGTGADGACTGATITGGAIEYNCTTLTITAGTYNFLRNPSPPVPPDPGYPGCSADHEHLPRREP